MKNIKLLLATTAMLSMGAMVAKADLPGLSDKADIKVSAEIVKNLSLDVEDIDFGTIAWDYASGEGSPYVDFSPNTDGTYTVEYNRVAFHKGGQLGKICWTDLVPGARRDQEFDILMNSTIPIYDNNNVEIGEIDFGNQADAGVTDGVRCWYMGGKISFNNTDAAKAFSGSINLTNEITVMYDSVNN